MQIVTINHRVIGKTDYTIYTMEEAKIAGVKINDPFYPVEGEYVETDDGYAVPVIKVYNLKGKYEQRQGDKIVRTPLASYTIVSGKVRRCNYATMSIRKKGHNSCLIGGFDIHNMRVSRRRKQFMIMAAKLRNIYKANEVVFGRKNVNKKKVVLKFNELHKIYEKGGDVMARIIKDSLEELGYNPDKIAKEFDKLYKSTKSDSVKLAILKDLKKTFDAAAIEAIAPEKQSFNGFKDGEVMKLVDKKKVG